MQMNIATNKPESLPRTSLGLKSFRAVEHYIADGCKGSVEITPPPGISNRSLSVKIREGILAKKRFDYPSALIPNNDVLYRLTVYPTTKGTVYIQNEASEKQTREVTSFRLESLAQLVADCQARKYVDNDFLISYNLPGEDDEIIARFNTLKGDMPFFGPEVRDGVVWIGWLAPKV